MNHELMRFARIRDINLRSALSSIVCLKSSGLVVLNFLGRHTIRPCFWLSEIMLSIYTYISFAISRKSSFNVSPHPFKEVLIDTICTRSVVGFPFLYSASHFVQCYRCV